MCSTLLGFYFWSDCSGCMLRVTAGPPPQGSTPGESVPPAFARLPPQPRPRRLNGRDTLLVLSCVRRKQSVHAVRLGSLTESGSRVVPCPPRGHEFCIFGAGKTSLRDTLPARSRINLSAFISSADGRPRTAGQLPHNLIRAPEWMPLKKNYSNLTYPVARTVILRSPFSSL